MRRCRDSSTGSVSDVGEATAAALANHFGSLAELQSATEEQIQEVPDVGPVVAAHVYKFFQEKHNRDVIAALIKHVHLQSQARKAAQGEGPLVGRTFVLTGSLDRKVCEQAKALGALECFEKPFSVSDWRRIQKMPG